MDRIWKKTATPAELDALCAGTMLTALGIRFVEVGEAVVRASMPVGPETRTPFGVLHGGASAALAESLGSVASYLATDESEEAFGIELNASHVRAASAGEVYGAARPLRLGRSVHVWSVQIDDAEGRAVCYARLTVAVRPRRARPA